MKIHIHNYYAAPHMRTRDKEFVEIEHPRDDDGKFGSGGTGSSASPTAEKTSTKPLTEKRSSPGSQLQEYVRTKLRDNGMVGTFPPADVPMSAIRMADMSRGKEALKYEPLMSWDQKTKNGRISRQYRYTQEFHDRNAAEKFARVSAIEPHMKKIGATLTAQMQDGSLSPKQRDAAAIASTIRETGLRPTDGDESIKHGHFGISSLQARHAKVQGNEIHLDFIGKEGVRNQTVIREPENVAFIKSALANKAGDQPIFAHADSSDAGDALKAASKAAGGPGNIKVKDLRTIKATQTAREAIASFHDEPPPLTGDPKKDVRLIQKAIMAMSAKVAKVLNNTPEQARDNYIHPEIFKSWQAKLAV